MVITEEDDKGNYQIIEHDTPTTNPIPARTLYFIDVTYDGTPEVLIDYGGFGAQNCTYMGCYRYDALAKYTTWYVHTKMESMYGW